MYSLKPLFGVIRRYAQLQCLHEQFFTARRSAAALRAWISEDKQNHSRRKRVFFVPPPPIAGTPTKVTKKCGSREGLGLIKGGGEVQSLGDLDAQRLRNASARVFPPPPGSALSPKGKGGDQRRGRKCQQFRVRHR